MKRKIIPIILALFILNSLLFQSGYADEINEGIPSIEAFKAVPAVKIPVINAVAAVVMDMESGRVLYEKNAYLKKDIASTTKIMTAIVAIENGKLGETVEVSKRAASVGGSSINLRQGETLTLRELLYGLMLNSGNDAAIAIAEHIGGTVDGFVQMMNDKALELGAMNTSFRSPHGLDMADHYSTAYDVALITRYALKNKVFAGIVATRTVRITGRNLYNTNEMLGLYPGADGVKTGYTGNAGRCLVTSATRNQWKVISVVLNAPTRSIRAQASKEILDYAFGEYKPTVLLQENQLVKKIPVIKGTKGEVNIRPVEGVSMPLTAGEKEGITARVDLPETLHAPVKAGIEVGKIEYFHEGKLLAQAMLKTETSVPGKGLLDYFKDILTAWGGIMK